MRGRHGAAEQTTRKHTVSGDADAQLRQYGKDVGFRPSADQRIFNLKIGDGMNPVRTANGVRSTSDNPTAACSR